MNILDVGAGFHTYPGSVRIDGTAANVKRIWCYYVGGMGEAAYTLRVEKR